MVDTSGIGEEASELGVLEEAASELRAAGIGFRDRRGEVVEDEVIGNAPEEAPALLEPLDDVLEPLAKQRPDEHVPTEREDDDERPDEVTLSRLGIREVAEASEVELGELPWRTLGRSDGRLR